MAHDREIDVLAGALHVSVGLLLRRLRQARAEGELTLPETAALARLDRGGPATSAALARAEQISPQSMGATLGALEAARPRRAARPTPTTAGGWSCRVTDAGRQVAARPPQRAHRAARAGAVGRLHRRRARAARAAAPLLERLAQSL